MGFRSSEILRQRSGRRSNSSARARDFCKISTLTGVTTPVTLLSALLNNRRCHRRHRHRFHLRCRYYCRRRRCHRHRGHHRYHHDRCRC